PPAPSRRRRQYRPRSACLSASASLVPSLLVGLDPDGLDHALAGHARPLARPLHARARRGLEQAEDELVPGEVERSPEGRLPFPGFTSGPSGSAPKLLLGDAG